LDYDVETITIVWDLPEVQKIVKNQFSNGSWQYLSKRVDICPIQNYPLVET
jgi:hypothetical protein